MNNVAIDKISLKFWSYNISHQKCVNNSVKSAFLRKRKY